jgi:hypothetical protein
VGIPDLLNLSIAQSNVIDLIECQMNETMQLDAKLLIIITINRLRTASAL